mmetsp:Transcript_58725/g.136609  ORF Transcript_58725/g.136609 Transcript_58725/m.136609 type:complete len:294 (-) Transcript_58725:108-989(-)|eukprot:CAMPEP_0171063696 /NCGR_PEP_ID=MMETSP0766_2-20121228/5830_1 /TAXON_ID=439317 /ORGANISM="Gambierdiscus australes, Strain CAWD 149" /LENGTH=293 /DNA_ID=CAMNT_0011519639 /DNA_START=26 /DNA_END=907 /DNA_ORIENTATION=-
MLLLAACAICHVGGVLLQGLDGDESSLLQDSVRVHGRWDPTDEVDEWLVDNSNLQHKGPGVLWRLSKELSNVAGKGEYVRWGSTVRGVDEGGDWVKVGEHYLPRTVHGAVVLVKKARARRILYKPTRVRAPDGLWVQCSITGPGSRPGTFNIMVRPTTIEDYPIQDVPVDALERLEEDREPEPAPAKNVPATANVGTSDREQQAELYLRVKVMNLDGRLMDMKLQKKSPLRWLMRMACERSRLRWERCQQEVRFEHDGKEVRGDDRWHIMGLHEDDTLTMSWKPTSAPAPRKK